MTKKQRNDPRLPAEMTRELMEDTGKLRAANFKLREGRKYGHIAQEEFALTLIERIMAKAWKLVAGTNGNGKRARKG